MFSMMEACFCATEAFLFLTRPTVLSQKSMDGTKFYIISWRKRSSHQVCCSSYFYICYVRLIIKETRKGITDTTSHFLWGDKDNQKRMHWMAWWKIHVQKLKEGWIFVISIVSIWRCCINKCGVSLRTQILLVPVLRAKYFFERWFVECKIKKGKVLWRGSIIRSMVKYGELAIGRILIFGKMRGSQIVLIEELSLLKRDILCQGLWSYYTATNSWD